MYPSELYIIYFCIKPEFHRSFPGPFQKNGANVHKLCADD